MSKRGENMERESPLRCFHSLQLKEGVSGRHTHAHYKCEGCGEKFWDHLQIDSKIEAVTHQRVARLVDKGLLVAGPKTLGLAASKNRAFSKKESRKHD